MYSRSTKAPRRAGRCSSAATDASCPSRNASSRRSSPSRARSSTTPRRSGRRSSRPRARRSAQAGIAAADVAAIGITNQRETTVLWDKQHRPAGGAGHRLAEPGQRADLRAAEGRRPRGADPPQDRPGRRRLLLGHEDHAPARHGARPARPRRGRRHPVRHHRHVPHLAPDRRREARHRRDQRQPHADVQHPHARLGRRAAADPRRAAGDAADGARLVRDLRRHRDVAVRRRRSPSPASPATSRRRCSARPASRPAWPRTPTAPAASC